MDLSYPPPMMTSESFARYTVLHRVPSLVEDVIAENEYPPEIVTSLHALRGEITNRPLAPLAENAPDVTAWNQAWETYRGCTWLEIPWYFAESYFYRRLLEATRYFQPGEWQGHDPFEARKQQVLEGGEGAGGRAAGRRGALCRVAARQSVGQSRRLE